MNHSKGIDKQCIAMQISEKMSRSRRMAIAATAAASALFVLFYWIDTVELLSQQDHEPSTSISIATQFRTPDSDNDFLSSSSALNVFEGCPEFNHVRPIGCFARSPPPTPRPCRKCSSQIHLSSGKNVSSSITISFAIDYSCSKNEKVNVNIMADGIPNDISANNTSTYRIKQYTSTSCMEDDPKKCKQPKSNVNEAHLCHAHSFGTYESDWFYHITVDGLEPDTHYSVEIDPPPCNANTKPSFSTAAWPPSQLKKTSTSFESIYLSHQKKASTQHNGMKIAIVGDPGQDDEATSTFNGIESMKDDLLLLVVAGDLSYANRDHRLWDKWFNKYESLFSTLPMLVTPGNHDIETDCCDWSVFKAYEHRFQMPEILPAELGYACVQADSSPPNYNFAGNYNYGNAYYSVVLGSAYVFFLNTYSDSSKKSPQFKWFSNEIKKVDRTVTPWLFVVTHGTLYETYQKHLEETGQMTMQRYMEPLFNKYKVNAVFSGHDHNYARMQPHGKKFKPTYITIGNGGHSRHQQDEKKHNEKWLVAMDWWSWGFGTLTVLNETHAFWQTHFHNDTNIDFVPGTDSVYLINEYVGSSETTMP